MISVLCPTSGCPPCGRAGSIFFLPKTYFSQISSILHFNRFGTQLYSANHRTSIFNPFYNRKQVPNLLYTSGIPIHIPAARFKVIHPNKLLGILLISGTRRLIIRTLLLSSGVPKMLMDFWYL